MKHTSPPIEILEGDTDAREILDALMMVDQEFRTQLGPIIGHIEKIEEKHGGVNWWLSMADERPLGFLSVVNHHRHSQLLFSWINPELTDEFDVVVAGLIREWIDSTKNERFTIDLEPGSYMIEAIKKAKFKFDKTLTITYAVETDYFDSELPENMYIRQPHDDELEWIYDNLIERDLVRGSPIYIGKHQFLQFAESTPKIRENWIVVVDEEEYIHGFGASNLEQSIGVVYPVLYGPHTFDPKIEDVIIAEFLTHWKLQGKDELAIRRTSEIRDTTKRRFSIKKNETLSVDRYTYKKSILRDFFS